MSIQVRALISPFAVALGFAMLFFATSGLSQSPLGKVTLVEAQAKITGFWNASSDHVDTETREAESHSDSEPDLFFAIKGVLHETAFSVMLCTTAPLHVFCAIVMAWTSLHERVVFMANGPMVMGMVLLFSVAIMPYLHDAHDFYFISVTQDATGKVQCLNRRTQTSGDDVFAFSRIKFAFSLAVLSCLQIIMYRDAGSWTFRQMTQMNWYFETAWAGLWKHTSLIVEFIVSLIMFCFAINMPWVSFVTNTWPNLYRESCSQCPSMLNDILLGLVTLFLLAHAKLEHADDRATRLWLLEDNTRNNYIDSWHWTIIKKLRDSAEKIQGIEWLECAVHILAFLLFKGFHQWLGVDCTAPDQSGGPCNTKTAENQRTANQNFALHDCMARVLCYVFCKISIRKRI